MSHYKPRYIEFMEKATVNNEMLPVKLQVLINKYKYAILAWEQADDSTKKSLLPVLVKADAVIAANIYQLYKDRLETEAVDKVKLMALKAKALQLKWKMKN